MNRSKITLGWKGKCQPGPEYVFVDITDQVAEERPPAPAISPQGPTVMPLIELDPLHICLDNWKGWMHRTDTDLGIQGGTSLRGDGDGYGNAETATMRRDNEIGEATDAMVRSLKVSHQWAIRRKCGLTRQNVWIFPQLDFMEEVADACDELEKKLRANIATRLLFN